MNPTRRLKMPDDLAALVRSLHPNIKRKVKAALHTILSDPEAGKALKDDLDGLSSFRLGKLRIIYKVASKGAIVEIIAIGPRKSIYEETLLLIKKQR